jgi:hypothetical protein
VRIAECGQCGLAVDHHGGDGGREAEERNPHAAYAARRNGWDGLLRDRHQVRDQTQQA